jgi:type II secretory pathway pseudopilin PulG
MTVPSSTGLTAGCPGQSGSRLHAVHGGFALVVTLALMVLLSILAVGLLSLSAVSLRASSGAQAESVARANARMAMMLAIGELQKQIGPDQRITAPSAILDADPESTSVDGVAHAHLTGVWNARDAANESLDSYNSSPPDYSRDKPNFRRWLVSNAKPEDVEQLNFAKDGALVNPTDLHGSKNPGQQVRAGKVPVKGGSYAWWVGDENTKAQINRRDLLAREASPTAAELLAGFVSPGAHGIKALAGFETFDSNSTTSDKSITRETISLTAPAGADPGELFHDITPYAQSVLASVTAGSLRKDLSLYLERTDIDWLRDWKNLNWQQGPLGPNGRIALSPLPEYDVLAWKTLHHYYHMHRQVSYVGNRPRVTATDSNPVGNPAPIDPVTNPEWNNGVTSINPVIVRMQNLISYGVKKVGEKDYDLYMHNYPVVTLWNPYNVDMKINGYNIWMQNLPLSHKIYKNDAPTTIPDFNWHYAGSLKGGTLGMRFGLPYGSPNEPIILKAGEMKIFNHKKSSFAWDGAHPTADMAENTEPASFYSTANTGHPRSVGTITGALETDTIAVETKLGTWDTFSNELKGYGWQSTFEVRSEPRGDHAGHNARTDKQVFSSMYAWRFEDPNWPANFLSKNNFPAKALKDLVDAPTPFCLVEVRLKPLDELRLLNKTWLHNIPALTYAGCHSSSQAADAKTSFFSHPYTVTFNQQTTVLGLFSTIPYMGPSYTPAGQRFIADREIPQVPLSSLAQIQNLPQVSMESMNWSGHLQQNHAIGNSYASPGVPSNKIKSGDWPFFLNPFINLVGNLSGEKLKGDSWTTAPNIDRSYAANHLLWDDYYFSSMAPQTGTFYQRFGTTRPLKTVVDEFYAGTKPLPNAAYVPHVAGMNAKAVSDSLVNAGGSPLTDAHLKSAAHLMIDGGFNINSTSVPAWTILLASSHLKRPVIMDSEGTGIPAAQTNGNFVVSRFAMPIGGSAGQTTSEEARWRGYRELTAAEIRQLAEAIVRQVKRRGPFRSLGEFVNRRLAADTDEKALYGALQAALEDPKVDINKDYRNKTITAADIKDTNYVFRQAALGSRFQGTPAYISQADILQPIAPLINARSDTFVIRTYGEALAPDGKTVLAKAWCEAVVQRCPEYINPKDKPETPVTTSGLQAENKAFGRRIVIKTFRWLSDEEI